MKPIAAAGVCVALASNIFCLSCAAEPEYQVYTCETHDDCGPRWECITEAGATSGYCTPSAAVAILLDKGLAAALMEDADFREWVRQESQVAMLPKDSANPLNHDRYTDSEAVLAMGDLADDNALNHERYTDQDTITAMGPKTESNALNHERYTNAEAVAAMGGASNNNPLNHPRYEDVEARAAVLPDLQLLASRSLIPEFLGTSSTFHDGDLEVVSDGTMLFGYQAAQELCRQSFPGANSPHMCTAHEMALVIQDPNQGYTWPSIWYATFTWTEGDCVGFTTAQGDSVGPVTGGTGAENKPSQQDCSIERPIACCGYPTVAVE